MSEDVTNARVVPDHVERAFTSLMRKCVEMGQLTGLTNAQRQCLIVCTTVELGPTKFKLSHEAGTGGMFTMLMTELYTLPNEEVRRRVLGAILRRLTIEYVQRLGFEEAAQVAA